MKSTFESKLASMLGELPTTDYERALVRARGMDVGELESILLEKRSFSVGDVGKAVSPYVGQAALWARHTGAGQRALGGLATGAALGLGSAALSSRDIDPQTGQKVGLMTHLRRHVVPGAVFGTLGGLAAKPVVQQLSAKPPVNLHGSVDLGGENWYSKAQNLVPRAREATSAYLRRAQAGHLQRQRTNRGVEVMSPVQNVQEFQEKYPPPPMTVTASVKKANFAQSASSFLGKNPWAGQALTTGALGAGANVLRRALSRPQINMATGRDDRPGYLGSALGGFAAGAAVPLVSQGAQALGRQVPGVQQIANKATAVLGSSKPAPTVPTDKLTQSQLDTKLQGAYTIPAGTGTSSKTWWGRTKQAPLPEHAGVIRSVGPTIHPSPEPRAPVTSDKRFVAQTAPISAADKLRQAMEAKAARMKSSGQRQARMPSEVDLGSWGEISKTNSVRRLEDALTKMAANGNIWQDPRVRGGLVGGAAIGAGMGVLHKALRGRQIDPQTGKQEGFLAGYGGSALKGAALGTLGAGAALVGGRVVKVSPGRPDVDPTSVFDFLPTENTPLQRPYPIPGAPPPQGSPVMGSPIGPPPSTIHDRPPYVSFPDISNVVSIDPSLHTQKIRQWGLQQRLSR